ncbi:hypothetical protein HYQ46_012064 [Verticillium longisporum]|nr:hypothetical protein HYQ46_012064 [Verticillium longisporum]
MQLGPRHRHRHRHRLAALQEAPSKEHRDPLPVACGLAVGTIYDVRARRLLLGHLCTPLDGALVFSPLRFAVARTTPAPAEPRHNAFLPSLASEGSSTREPAQPCCHRASP